MKIRNISLYLVSFSLLSGCWATRADLDAQALRVQTLEEGVAKEQRKQESHLQDATSVVRRNSADQGQQIIDLQNRLDSLEGAIAEVRHASESFNAARATTDEALTARIDAIARAAGIDVPLPDASIPQDRDQHFNAGLAAMAQSEYATARALFRRYIERFPTDGRADDALYQVGLSYLRQGKPADALTEFKKVLSDYRKGDVLDRTLYDMSEAFYTLHSCANAQKALDALLQRYPTSPLVTDAKARLAEVKSAGPANCKQN